MRITIEIEQRGPTPGMMKREWNNLLKLAYLNLGQWYVREIIPQHFEYSAYAAYGYKARTRRYMQRKARTKGHQRPLMWSGESYSLAKQGTARSTSKGGTVAFRAFTLNKRRGDGPFMRKELLAWNAQDQLRAQAYLQGDINKQIALFASRPANHYRVTAGRMSEIYGG